MAYKVKLKKSHLDRFRKLARDSPYEIQAYLIGEVISPTLTVVKQFVYPKEYKIQTATHVQWTEEEYQKARQLAEELGCDIVGDIHSHPNWGTVMSPEDYRGAIVGGLTVCGICSVNNRKTRVDFWIMHSALPCEIVYETTKRAPNLSKKNTKRRPAKSKSKATRECDADVSGHGD